MGIQSSSPVNSGGSHHTCCTEMDGGCMRRSEVRLLSKPSPSKERPPSAPFASHSPPGIRPSPFLMTEPSPSTPRVELTGQDIPPLNQMASCDDVVGMEQLLNAGARVDELDGFGRTPLHYAVYNGHLAACQLLLSRNANPNQVAQDGQTPRDYLAEEGRNGQHAPALFHILRDAGDAHRQTLAAEPTTRRFRPSPVAALQPHESARQGWFAGGEVQRTPSTGKQVTIGQTEVISLSAASSHRTVALSHTSAAPAESPPRWPEAAPLESWHRDHLSGLTDSPAAPVDDGMPLRPSPANSGRATPVGFERTFAAASASVSPPFSLSPPFSASRASADPEPRGWSWGGRRSLSPGATESGRDESGRDTGRRSQRAGSAGPYDALYFPRTNTGVYGVPDVPLKPVDAPPPHGADGGPGERPSRVVGHTPLREGTPRKLAQLARRREVLEAHSQVFGKGTPPGYHVF